MLGNEDGFVDGRELGVDDGSCVGIGDGILVGEQIGGLPSGDGLNIGLSSAHSSGQQTHP